MTSYPASSICLVLLLSLQQPLVQAHNNKLLRATAADDHHYHVVDWFNVTATSKTMATLQVVANPILNTEISPVAKRLFENLNHLQADLVRYVPWFPYPHYGVAELDPPNVTTQITSWNFSKELKQEFLDTFRAVTSPPPDTDADTDKTHQKKKKKRMVINFSTQPTWMFNTSHWSYSQDPNHADWNYIKGRWINSTTQLVADYYGRLAEWIVLGHFVDEFGHKHTGGPALQDDVTHWEIFNEPEGEHSITPQQYNALYDAIVRAIRVKADPQKKIQFMGMALEGHREWDYWKGFLTPENHAEDVRDAVANGYASFHWYTHCSNRTNASTFEEAFVRIPSFLEEIDEIVRLRDSLSPTTQLALNEAGVIPVKDNDPNAAALPPVYFNMAAGLFTVLISELSRKGVEVVGSSQFCGCPALPQWHILDRQFPGVSMTNWTTGEGNPRYWALKLYLQYFGPGDKIVHSSEAHLDDNSSNDDVYVQGRITHRGNNYVVIVVNKTNRVQRLTLKHLNGAHVNLVDESTHDTAWKEFTSHSDTLVLGRFAVAVVHVTQMMPEELETRAEEK